jgi:signal transduction histidine kinase
LSQPLPVDRSLPAEVATSASQLLQYLRYPVFSWSWWWRRLIFFAPVAIVMAVSDANEHGTFVQDASQALSIAWRAAIAYVLFVAGGPLLAVAARHAHLPQTVERVLVVLGIVAGFFIADTASNWSDRYHAQLMCAREGLVECPEPEKKKVEPSTLGAVVTAVVPVGFYFAFGGGLALISYFREQHSWRELQRRREHEQLQLQKIEADARLSVLQAQVEPHFLFNTLASLRSLIRSEPQRAEATIDALVDHLRATLPRMRGETAEARSTLAAQIDICRSYLEVMRVRMGTRLTLGIDIPPELAALSFPPLMLISLVENAVKHGVEPKPGPCTITLAARRISVDGRDCLEVVVSDDGAGLREGLGQGVGLANIREQLAIRYGGRASMELRNGPRGGAVATLRIPADGGTA